MSEWDPGGRSETVAPFPRKNSLKITMAILFVVLFFLVKVMLRAQIRLVRFETNPVFVNDKLDEEATEDCPVESG